MNQQTGQTAEEDLIATLTGGMSAVDTFLCLDNLPRQVAGLHAEKAAAALATLLPRIVEISWTADAEMGDEGQTYFNYSAASYRRDDGVAVDVQDPDAVDSFVVSLVSPDNSVDPTLKALIDLYEFRDTERHADLDGYEQVVALMAEFTGAASRESMHQAVDILWRAIYAFPAAESHTRLLLRPTATH